MVVASLVESRLFCRENLDFPVYALTSGQASVQSFGRKLALCCPIPAEKTCELVNSTDRIFTFVQSRSIMGTIAHSILLPYVLPIAFKLPWMATFAFKKNSQIQISYAQSNLSIGNGAGYRLPWIEISESDNYRSLQNLNWVMHVYGKASDEMTTLALKSDVPLHQFGWSDSKQCDSIVS
jgi:hypothetical protein